MKPIKLTMTAFGPYKDIEVIDFTELKEHRLFLVSGNTGAGKTSIFDAICFALYGEASGEDRNDVRMLRSQFASDDVYTAVEFEFEIKRRTYRILRQLSHVKQGNKSATGEKYEFVETTGGRETMMVDRYMVRQINERVQSLVGLTKDQFGQIVMLPQGEFRKLLTSDTENKEEILRRIFRTHLYKYVTEYLNEKRKTAQNDCDLAKRDLDAQTMNLKLAISEREGSELHRVLGEELYNTHQVLEALEAEIGYYAAEKEGRRTKLEAEIKLQRELTEKYHQAAGLNEQFDMLSRKTTEKINLESRIPEFEQKRQRLAWAEKTLPLQVQERHVVGAREDVRAKERYMESSREELRLAEEGFRLTEEAYRLEEKQEGRREQLVRELERLGRDLPTVQALESHKTRVGRLEKEAAQAEEDLKAADGRASSRLEEKKALTDRVRKLEESVRPLPEMNQKLERMRTEATLLRDCIQWAKELDNLRSEERKQKELHDQSAREYAQLESRWLEGQAGLLAGHLRDGAPCPVCGSAEHPRKAAVSADMPSREELERQRNRKAELESVYLAGKTKREHLEAQLQAKTAEAAALGYAADDLESSYLTLVETGKSISAGVKRMQADQAVLDECKQTLDQTEKQLETESADKERKAAFHQERRTAYLTDKALYEQSLNSVPEELRSLETLQRRLKETEAEKQRAETAWRLAQERFQQAGAKLAATQASRAAAEKQLEEARARLAQAEEEFHGEIARAGFETAEAYLQAKMPNDARAEVKRDIDRFHAELATVRKQVEELEAMLRGKERADLAALAAEMERLDQQVELTRHSLAQAQDHYGKATEGKEKILSAEQRWKEAEKDFQLVKDLYDVVRGENRFKISFERFLLVEFLDRILQAANLRLQTISGGQFYLARSRRQEKHGRQSGLGLDVYDTYTEQFRDVKTLSGGEKFNASLCLALGMADVIQAYEGGISLETMFIDEGFGSLDEESLNKAIDTLIQLQQTGRMIGIISHVPELKQAIPAILEVKKASEGHSYTRFRVS